MSDFVIDASAALAWLLPSQSTPASERFLGQRGDHRYLAPHIFDWEMGNVLVAQHRRGRLSERAHRQAMADLEALSVLVHAAVSTSDVRELIVLARSVGLSLFDAAYLNLALVEGCHLVSRDDQLLAVAQSEGVGTVDLRWSKPT